MSVYETVRAYHAEHGDDVSVGSRIKRYRAIIQLAGDTSAKTVLDVGCGSRKLRHCMQYGSYEGIDLLEGVNILDYDDDHDIVIGNGLFYKLPDAEEAWKLIRHMWSLARETLIFTTLSAWAPKHYEDELSLDPVGTILRCYHLTPRIAFRHDYLPHDFAVALHR